MTRTEGIIIVMTSYPKARQVLCPVCSAQPGNPCRYVGDSHLFTSPMATLHDSRYRAARDEIRDCTANISGFPTAQLVIVSAVDYSQG